MPKHLFKKEHSPARIGDLSKRSWLEMDLVQNTKSQLPGKGNIQAREQLTSLIQLQLVEKNPPSSRF
jgi:hypothetical protein